MLGIDYEIQHKKGTENLVADALSSKPDGKLQDQVESVAAVTTVQPKWIQQIVLSYEEDEEAL